MANKNYKPVVKDQYEAAQIYFACVVGMLFFEFLLVLPGFFWKIFKKYPFIKTSKRHNKLHVLCHKLTTLPSPIPFLTNHQIPDLLRLLVFAGLNILFGWNRLRFTTDYKLYGWLCIANGGIALLMAPRTNLFGTILRIPSPVLLFYHRLVGLATIVHATVHWGTTAAHYVRTEQLATVLESGYTQAGLAAWSALVIIALTAILRVVRRQAFEVFYYAHFVFIVFVIAACIHTDHSLEFLMPGFGLWVVDRIIRFTYNFRKITAESVVHYPGGVTKFKVRGFKVRRPNQMAWVQLPGVSFFNWHPFTVASAPGDDVATFAIRGLGGFTKRVQGLAVEGHSSSSVHEKNGARHKAVSVPGKEVKIRVDGPYGHPALQWEQYPVVVLIAGGIGITPAISITSHIVRWAAKAPVGLGSRHVHLLWAIRDVEHAQWFEEEMTELARVIREDDVPVTLDIDIYASGKKTKSSEESSVETGDGYVFRGPATVHEGRPDVEAWLGEVREKRRGLDAAVDLCGPRTLIDMGRKAAAKLSCEEGLFHVEEEVFEF